MSLAGAPRRQTFSWSVRRNSPAVCFASICITYLCLGANVKLRAGRSVVNGGCVRVDVIRGDGFVATEDIEGWELCFVVSLQKLAVGHASILRCLCKGTFDGVGGQVSKELPKAWIVRLPLDGRPFMGFEVDILGRDDEVFELLAGVHKIVVDNGAMDKEGLMDISKFVEHWIDFGWHVGDGVIPLCVIIAIVIKYKGIPVAVGCEEYVWVLLVFVVRVGTLFDVG